MKSILVLAITFFLYSCNDKENETLSTDYRDITHLLKPQEFESIKFFILENGDIEGYCQMYNNNPHYSFTNFEAYLDPETGQRNIDCNPDSSDFNVLVIRDRYADPQYYDILIIRKGDIGKEEIYTPEGLQEDRVYLSNYYDYDLDSMQANVAVYIDIIKGEINNK